MFNSSISPKQFIKAIQELELATGSSSPKALQNAFKRIRERSEGFEGSKFSELVEFIANPPKKSKSPNKRTRSQSQVKRGPSPELIAEIIVELEKTETIESEFRKVLDAYSKSCTAKVFRDVAASYAAASTPPTKSAAIELLLGERANRLRTRKKSKTQLKHLHGKRLQISLPPYPRHPGLRPLSLFLKPG